VNIDIVQQVQPENRSVIDHVERPSEHKTGFSPSLHSRTKSNVSLNGGI